MERQLRDPRSRGHGIFVLISFSLSLFRVPLVLPAHDFGPLVYLLLVFPLLR